MANLLPVKDALRQILADVVPVGEEIVALDDALGRTLAMPVIAERDQPPFHASAMDGYAVRFEDVVGKTPMLKLVGLSRAGHGFAERLKPGEAVRIFTGAPVPEGADAVVVQENVTADGDRVQVNEAESRPRHIRKKGLDVARGDMLIAAGTLLTARHIGLAASANQAHLAVRRKPVIAILPTGDELVEPGSLPRDDQILSSNNHALSSFVRSFGGLAVDLGIVGDTLPALEAAIERGLDADVLVTIGGASVGDHDLVQEALVRSGLKLAFWRLAIRPGKPLMFGHLEGKRVLGLPGNPVSALVCARVFLHPLMMALLGRTAGDDVETVPLAEGLKANDERQDYIRAKLVRDAGGRLCARAMEIQDSSMQRSLANADCLIIRPPHAPTAEAGSAVEILRLDF
ncbi:molybdopterin molybdotransferase [Rhodoligotrophos appendicifer]|uniref:molybdopterin molybdotransferase MoeA n=1 Tax=Rhodoligotrophos appendicifer TaxID=987056 RepID=UPI0011872B0D|nr:gephyrin-like molybdotransferase Glp [Rhodoligotrophos appendicifer]